MDNVKTKGISDIGKWRISQEDHEKCLWDF
jgi:hypothetical protein